ncbi:hypothetical protein DL764_001693 [Monosporascus ibericus]|uniref:Ketoreductase (KR) domain-containing protein n=1 Tax=Monosporascus ibericus TaxID=155417 RepID=A0A4Q4TQ73_9PEZI|nr:hypothetical protein DL764_001693 [Monosporascus ibericus]
MASPQENSTSKLGAGKLFSVDGLVAVVTGGGTGIGLMITKALVANGASKVYILGRRLAVLEEAAKSTESSAVIPLVCDVTSQTDLAAAASKVHSEVGYVNLVVCNSGIGGPYGIRPRPDMSLDEYVSANLAVDFDDYTKTFAINTTAVWYTAMLFLKLLEYVSMHTPAGNKQGNVEQKSQVVAVSSIGGFNKQNTGGYAYGQSKAACTHLIKQLSIALPQWDIRANVICPGLERPGDEQDMAGAILYLASRAGAYCNGAVIVSDGGRLGTFPSTF